MTTRFELRIDPAAAARASAVLFVLVMTALTLREVGRYPFPFIGFDEHGHVSYVLHLLRTGGLWPDFATMPIYDRAGAATAVPNFINHPPLFYWLAEPAQRAVEALGLDPSWIRLFSLGFVLAAFCAMAAFGLAAGFGPLGFAGFAAALAFLLVPAFSAPFNNDQMALAGGAIACLGAFRRLADETDRSGLPLLLVGVAMSAVKLTSLLLVGGFAGFALLLAPRMKFDMRGLAWLACVLAVCALPYAALWVTAGGFAPNTPGQDLLLRQYSAANGWDVMPRIGLLDYVCAAPFLFAIQLGKGLGVAFAFIALCALPLFALARPRPDEAAAYAVARAGLAATAAMIVVHLGFSYRRHLDYGWLGDLYPRYYFPLLAAYGLGWLIAARMIARRVFVLSRRALSAIRPQISANRPV